MANPNHLIGFTLATERRAKSLKTMAIAHHFESPARIDW
jgi:hypothetical protein